MLDGALYVRRQDFGLVNLEIWIIEGRIIEVLLYMLKPSVCYLLQSSLFILHLVSPMPCDTCVFALHSPLCHSPHI